MSATRGTASPKNLEGMYRYRRAAILTLVLAGLASLYAFLMSTAWLPTSPALRLLLPCVTLWFIAVALYGLFRSETLMNQALREMDRSAMMRLERMARTSEPGSSNDYLYLKARLEEEKARVDRHGGVMSLLYLQLEDYNQIKTEYGAKITDEVLNQLGESMVVHLRRYDALRRIYPNRYLVLLPETNRRDARKVGRSLVQMGQDYTYQLPAGGSVNGLELTCGIAAYPINGDGVENVVTAAHAACRDARMGEEAPIAMSEQFVRTDSSGEQVVSDVRETDT